MLKNSDAGSMSMMLKFFNINAYFFFVKSGDTYFEKPIKIKIQTSPSNFLIVNDAYVKSGDRRVFWLSIMMLIKICVNVLLLLGDLLYNSYVNSLSELFLIILFGYTTVSKGSMR